MSERAYTAILRNDRVLMVRHIHQGRDYWTLPGGHVEAGETPEQTARREVLEETGLEILGLRRLYRDETGTCFLGSCAPELEAVVGCDPELDDDGQRLVDVCWFNLNDVADDWQVSRVLAHIRTDP